MRYHIDKDFAYRTPLYHSVPFRQALSRIIQLVARYRHLGGRDALIFLVIVILRLKL